MAKSRFARSLAKNESDRIGKSFALRELGRNLEIKAGRRSKELTQLCSANFRIFSRETIVAYIPIDSAQRAKQEKKTTKGKYKN